MQRPQRISLFQDVFLSDLCDLRIDLCGLCVKFLLLVAALPRRVIRGHVFSHCLNRMVSIKLGFSGQIYGMDISVYFIERLRDVKKFPGAAELIIAIEHDVERTETILNSMDERLVKISL